MKRWGDTLEELREILPPDVLAAFVARFGGRIIRVPVKLREPRAERARRVVEALRTLSYSRAARATGVPVRTVQRDSQRSA